MKRLFCLSLLAAFTLCGCESDSGDGDKTSNESSTSSAIMNGILADAEAHRAVVALRTAEPNSTFCTGTRLHQTLF